jgi:hypothetical protein
MPAPRPDATLSELSQEVLAMRILPLALLAVIIPSATAQQPPPAGSNWQHVQALPAGTSIHVNTKTGKQLCNLKSATDDTLTCTHGKDLVFQRSEIKSIKLTKHSRSSATGAAIGGGAGIAIVEAAWNNHWSFNGINRGSVAAFAGVPLAVAGGFVGYFTDFTASTVYKAP